MSLHYYVTQQMEPMWCNVIWHTNTWRHSTPIIKCFFGLSDSDEFLVQTLSDLCNIYTYEPECPAQVEFCAIRNWVYINVQGSPTDIHAQTHRHLTGLRVTATPSVLSPISIPPPPLLHCVFIPAGKNSVHVSKMLLFQFFLSFFELRVWNCVALNCARRGVSI
jgi:hypothetical protein